MDASISRFVRILRQTGVGVSPAEALDAMRALACVRLDDRATVRDTLRATLIKDAHDAPVFEDLFDLFFGPPRTQSSADHAAAAAATSEQSTPDLTRLALDTEDDGLSLGQGAERPDASVKIQPGSLEEIARNLSIDQARAILDPAMQRSTHQVNVRRSGNAFRPGELNLAECGPGIEADLLLDALDQLLGDDTTDGVPSALDDTIATILDQLPDALQRALRRRLAERLDRSQASEAKKKMRPQRFSEAEHREMADIVRRLGRQMKGARSYRRVVGRRGRVNVARTLRASMAFDGIPFRPVVTVTRDERPRIVVLCDVSLSVRNTARFMLHLVYSLQSLFEAVRSFVFVSDLAEASTCFERFGIDAAIGCIFDGGLIDCDANSDYGLALGQFVQRHLDAVTAETTVIVLGDGRGNRNPPNAAALEEIRRRAKQLVWLSPEPRGSWGLGSSDMPLYAPICHRTEVVRNLAQLGEVADGLFRRSVAAGGGHAGGGHG
jgi:Protein containing von Willebrand factor type A (vWA) domain